MELLYKPDFDEARTRWDAFWNKQIIDRPCLSVTAPRDGAAPAPSPGHQLAGWDGDYAETAARWDAHLASRYFGAEAIPFMMASFGPDQFGAFLGADLERASSLPNATSWAVPIVEDWATAAPIRLDESNRWWRKMLAFLRAAGEASEGKFLVGQLDLHSNLDALASLREPQCLCMDLLDCPELVERAMRQARALFVPIYDALYKAGRMEGRGSIGWLPLYSPGKFMTTQCDFAAMISPAMFNRFAMPALEEEWAYLDHSAYHLDGPQALAHLDTILAARDLDLIQWVPGAGKPPQHEWVELLQTIQAAGKSVIVQAPAEACKRLHSVLKPELTFYATSAPSQKEADALARWFVDHT